MQEGFGAVQVRDDQGNVLSDAPGAPPLYPVSDAALVLFT